MQHLANINAIDAAHPLLPTSCLSSQPISNLLTSVSTNPFASTKFQSKSGLHLVW